MAPTAVNPFLQLLIDGLKRYILAHPEVVDQLIEEGAQALIAWLKTLHPAPPSA